MAIVTANDNFNWDEVLTGGGKSAANKFGGGYSPEQRAEMEAQLEATLSTVTDDQLITGTVVGLTERDVIVNIGFKSDGLVSRNEFRGETLPQPGETVEVLVENTEDPNGQLILSRKKAKVKQAWQSIYDALENDTILEGVIKRRTKGGLIMEINGVEAFLPGSQIDVKPVRDFDIYVGKRMEVKVVKINAAFDNVVVSHKVLIEKDLEAQRAAILNNLEKGQVLEGVIKNMTNFGVFIDLGGVDGLLHITDISWGRVQHPSEALKLDEKVRIVVLDFDEDKKRISLGMKQLLPHPWDSLPADLGPGSRVAGRVVNVADYGAFMEVVPGVEGLIHVSEMSWSQHLRDPKDFVKANDQIEAVVLTLDREDRKMSLGLKQLTPDPWTREDFAAKYAVGTKHNGLVRNLTNFGLFVELEEGVDGLVHVSDLSWTKKVKHPSEFVKVSERLDVIVLEVDINNRRLALGHKQLEANPWDAFTAVFTPGSIHKGTIIDKNERGATIELPYGIEGFVYPKNLVKQDGTPTENGETLDFRVTDFSKDDRRVVLSHLATYTEQKQSDADRDLTRFTKKKGAAGAGGNAASGTAAGAAAPAEKSTMGDLDALSSLKAKMMTNESTAARTKLAGAAAAGAAAASTDTGAADAGTEATAAPAAEEGSLLDKAKAAVAGAVERVQDAVGDVQLPEAVTNAIDSAKAAVADVQMPDAVTNAMDSAKAAMADVHMPEAVTNAIDSAKAAIADVHVPEAVTNAIDSAKTAIANAQMPEAVTNAVDAVKDAVANVHVPEAVSDAVEAVKGMAESVIERVQDALGGEDKEDAPAPEKPARKTAKKAAPAAEGDAPTAEGGSEPA